MATQENLTKFNLLALNYLSEGLADTFAEKPETDMSLLGGMMIDTILWKVKQPIWGEGPFHGPPISYPRDWKQALKARFAPAWFKRRWPVQHEVKRFKTRVLYPRLSFPEQEHLFAVDVVDAA